MFDEVAHGIKYIAFRAHPFHVPQVDCSKVLMRIVSERPYNHVHEEIMHEPPLCFVRSGCGKRFKCALSIHPHNEVHLDGASGWVFAHI
jgi:hypothetical protein